MNRRPEELRHIGIISDFLCDEYPEKFERSEYTHPLLGVCKTLKIKNIIELDYRRINRINLDYLNSWIQIEVNSPTDVINIKDFIKDRSVM